jgi:HAMP domain-containing protein
MDFPHAQTTARDAGHGRAAAGAALFCLAAYCILLMLKVGAVAGGSDSSGYMNHARLLASDRVHVAPRLVPGLPQSDAPAFLYVPLGFKPAWNGDGLVPTYPAGFALFILAFKPFAGWRHAGDATIVLHSLAGLVLTYGLGLSLGLGRRWAAIGALIIAASPLYLWSSLQAMSDVPSLAWTTAAVLAALKSRENAPWALAAGAAMAVDVLLRPTNALAFVPAAVAIGMSPKGWILFLLGGLPGAIFFAAHSASAYGSILSTGYGDSFFAFSSRYVPETLLHYARWLPAVFSPVAALVLFLPWLGRARSPGRLVLGSWILVFGGFYATYVCTHETWWYLRFLLPAAPAFVLGGLLVLRQGLARVPAGLDPGRSSAAFAVAAALTLVYSGWWVRDLRALDIGKSELRYGEVADWMQTHVPADAVCLAMQASGSLFYYTHFVFIRWDALDATNVGRIDAAIRKSGRPLYAVLFPFEEDESAVLEKRMPGHWDRVKKIEDVTIWRRDFGAAKP